MKRTLFACLIAVGLSSAALADGGDAKAGKKLFKRCSACHVYDKDKNKVGPHLVDIVGRKFGAAEKFKYSKALLKMAEEGLVWDKDNLDKYLTKPKDFIKRGKMIFRGLKRKKDRDNLIAFLEAEAKKAD
ncbi:MAG: cytochrome c family protein [Pseudomonadota bacterium]